MNALSRYLFVTFVACAASSNSFAADSQPKNNDQPLSQEPPVLLQMARPLEAAPIASPPAATAAAAAPAVTAAPVATAAPQSIAAPPAVSQKPNPEQAALIASLARLTLTGWNNVAGLAADANPDKTAMLKEFGCRESFSKGFQRGQRRIDVVVYSFSSSQGAYAAYALLRKGSSTFVAKGDASSEDDQSVSIWKDRFFISVSGTSEDDEESKLAVSTIATQLTNVIAGRGELPQALLRLPSLDRVRGSERIVMGPVSARHFFPAPSLNMLSLPGSLGGGIADYQYQAPFRERMKLLLVDYGSPAAAAQAYQQYIQSIEEQHQNISPTDVESRALFKMANSYLLCELRSQRILLISGARKRSAPLMLARQVM